LFIFHFLFGPFFSPSAFQADLRHDVSLLVNNMAMVAVIGN